MLAVIAEPATPCGLPAIIAVEASFNGSSPIPVISNMPNSLVAPKRFLKSTDQAQVVVALAFEV